MSAAEHPTSPAQALIDALVTYFHLAAAWDSIPTSEHYHNSKDYQEAVEAWIDKSAEGLVAVAKLLARHGAEHVRVGVTVETLLHDLATVHLVEWVRSFPDFPASPIIHHLFKLLERATTITEEGSSPTTSPQFAAETSPFSEAAMPLAEPFVNTPIGIDASALHSQLLGHLAAAEAHAIRSEAEVVICRGKLEEAERTLSDARDQRDALRSTTYDFECDMGWHSEPAGGAL